MQSRTLHNVRLHTQHQQAFGAAAMAADLPKEGTFSGTYSAVGTTKAIPIGKERILLTFDENGLSEGEGLFNHWTWHCWGLGDFTNGMGLAHGYCVGTDPAGDQVAINFADEKHPLDQKIVPGSFTLTTGTGKYAGITGSATYEGDESAFRSPEGGLTLITTRIAAVTNSRDVGIKKISSSRSGGEQRRPRFCCRALIINDAPKLGH